jgi:hypothetical protein
MPEHVDRLGDIERGWTIYCDDDGPRFTVEGHEPTPAAYAALDRVEVVPAADHQGAVEALDEILRVVDGVERGEPFGTEYGSENPLPYIGDVARRAGGGGSAMDVLGRWTVRCPWCEAMPGEPCVGERPAAGVHPIRVGVEFDHLRRQLAGAVEALRELDAWASRMPDAGLTSDDPRWDWWHERPRPDLGGR